MSDNLEILKFDSPVLLAGPADVNFDQLRQLAQRGFPIVAADGGANRLLENGIVPQAIIGDLDSLDRAKELSPDTRLVQLAEQDTTDFEKCLYSVQAPIYLAIGFTGMRLDHTLATLHAMLKYRSRKNVLLLAGEDISFTHSGNYALSCALGTTISLFPLFPISFSHSEGLAFALKGIELGIGSKVGTSNRTSSADVQIIPSDQHQNTPYLITLPNNMLEMLIQPHLKQEN